MPKFICYYKIMSKLKYLLIIVFSFQLFVSCQTLKNKTNKIVEKENERLSKYIGQKSDLLKLELGQPDDDFKKENGNLELVYKNKKYGILCERRFEVNEELIVIGFVSNGCF